MSDPQPRARERLLQRPTASIPACRCEVPRCDEVTRERKPWCSAHVLEHSPQAKAAHAAIQRRERTITRCLERQRRIDLGGSHAARRLPPNPVSLADPMCSDAMQHLRDKGPLSLPGLARSLSVPVPVAQCVAARLVGARIARRCVSARGLDTLEMR